MKKIVLIIAIALSPTLANADTNSTAYVTLSNIGYEVIHGSSPITDSNGFHAYTESVCTRQTL